MRPPKFCDKQQKWVNMRCRCMSCRSVREENRRALVSELSHVQMTENKSTSSNHETQTMFLANLSRRVMGELIVYQSLGRPSVRTHEWTLVGYCEIPKFLFPKLIYSK